MKVAPLAGRRLAVAALLVSAGLGCGREPAPVEPAGVESEAPSLLVDATAGSGVDFVHANGASPARLLPETMGSGVAVFDADGDGRADLLFADGGRLERESSPRPLALYRNLGSWRFERIADAGGVIVDGYAMGLAVGDVDGDGDLDVLVTTVGATAGAGGDRLFLNRGDGTFDDVSKAWGLKPDGGFGSSAAFFDADGDGDLDLFSGRYVEWSLAGDVDCSPDGQHRTYCTPEVYEGAVSRFYRNLGGRFADETAATGIAAPGKTLGVAVIDVNDDGRLDLAIANDTVPNQLWINLGEAGFEERAPLAGFAVDSSGSARGGMGIAAGDLDSNGHIDLVVGNFANETAGLFLGEPDGLFREATAEARLGIPTLLSLTFGTLVADLDGDGWLDVVFANGHIEPDIATVSNGRQSYEQPLQVFLNRVDHFVESPGPAGRYVGRGLASGDLDGDGDLDLVLSQNGRPAVLLRNDAPVAGSRRLRLCGPGANTWGQGAEVAIETTAGRTLLRRLEPAGSYLSSSEPVLTIALAEGEGLSRVAIEWPGGARNEYGSEQLRVEEGLLVLRSEASSPGCAPAAPRL
ncbi:MAG TPA: CRTAC1 family protein [Thermoanaerobaculia bacterium]|nr:CRTAC1 family protein [Thermoanaerobaculia bacterium]